MTDIQSDKWFVILVVVWRDLFYIYGDKKYLSPAQCYDKFKTAGLDVPHFLLPPEDEKHIPPHIVAMTLLQMYSDKVAQESKADE